MTRPLPKPVLAWTFCANGKLVAYTMGMKWVNTQGGYWQRVRIVPVRRKNSKHRSANTGGRS